MFYGLKALDNKRFKLCHQVMFDDKMVCSKIPEWMVKTFDREMDKSFFKTKIFHDFVWRCTTCNIVASNAYEFFTHAKTKRAHFWEKLK